MYHVSVCVYIVPLNFDVCNLEMNASLQSNVSRMVKLKMLCMMEEHA